MKRTRIVLAASLLMVAVITSACAEAAGQGQTVIVKLTRTCTCCKRWISHMRSEGFNVETEYVDVIGVVKREYNIGPPLAACHTSLVEGYIVEGHVPAADVARLLAERPDIAGISAPGMPVGAPGMEGPNPARYRVLAFDSDGKIASVFARH